MLALKAQSEARAEKVSASRAAVAAEKAKEQAFLAEYPFEVRLSSYYPCSFTLSIDGHTATEVRISSGAPESFRIHRSAELNDASCEGVVPTEHHPPSDEVEVRINGANYVPKWILEKSAKLGKSYEAVIAPATN